MAQYANFLFVKKLKKATPEEKEKLIQDFISIVENLFQKDIFIRQFLTALAKRLIAQPKPLNATELKLIEEIKRIYGRTTKSVQHLTTMVTDMQENVALIKAFKQSQ